MAFKMGAQNRKGEPLDMSEKSKLSPNCVVEYMQKLIDRKDVTSMSRFLALNVVMSTLLGWIFNSIWLGYMVSIPDSVLNFNYLVVGGRTIQGAAEAIGGFFKRKDEQ